MTGPNLVTEKAAGELWCPWSRVGAPDDGHSFNRIDAGRVNGHPVEAVRNPRMARCIGSHCCAWRWGETGDLGYCGAAGAP